MEACVVVVACAEEDFVVRIILLEEACQMFSKIGLCSMQRFQQAHGRAEQRIGAHPLPPKVKDSCNHHDAVDGGGNKAKEAQSEQEMKHCRDTVHLNKGR